MVFNRLFPVLFEGMAIMLWLIIMGQGEAPVGRHRLMAVAVFSKQGRVRIVLLNRTRSRRSKGTPD
jgi:hypothetical protein